MIKNIVFEIKTIEVNAVEYEDFCTDEPTTLLYNPEEIITALKDYLKYLESEDYEGVKLEIRGISDYGNFVFRIKKDNILVFTALNETQLGNEAAEKLDKIKQILMG